MPFQRCSRNYLIMASLLLTYENQLEASRENAVRASVTASLELLNKNEETILFYTALSIIGFGIYTFRDILSAVLQMDLQQFDKCRGTFGVMA